MTTYDKARLIHLATGHGDRLERLHADLIGWVLESDAPITTAVEITVDALYRDVMAGTYKKPTPPEALEDVYTTLMEQQAENRDHVLFDELEENDDDLLPY
jgi:hypothetical protein